MANLKHVPDEELRFCVKDGEPWPCLMATARDGVIAMMRGEITVDEAVARVSNWTDKRDDRQH